MRRKLLVILALLLGITTLQARPVDVAKAQRLGRNFVQHKAMFAKNAVQDLQLAYTQYADNGMATMYVFNFDGGYVIVAADDSSSPILGYSDQGSFAYENAPDGLRFMLDELSRGIVTVVEQGHPVSSDIVSRWKNLEAYGYLQADKGHTIVEPLVQQRWDQGSPFNMYAPNGCPSGCVATAMAQLMKYWEWPVTGTGEHRYYAPLYGEQYANFGATTYDWANMIDYYGNGASQEEREAVATLMYHCGVSVDMNYEPSGSGAYSGDVPAAISTYFSYTDKSYYIMKGGNYDEWITLLKSNIDQRIPIYYSGHGDGGGHAFICDGYDADGLFHFNFGWGGSSNNFLLIDGENFEYSGSQGVVVDFVPDYVYNAMPQAAENLAVTIDSDVSLTGHLTWTNPTKAETGEPLTNLDKVVVMRNGIIVHEIENVEPGQVMSCDDEVPFFDQYDYSVMAVNGSSYGRTTHTKAVFGPYCEWTVIMTSSDFHGWNGGGITVQNAAGSYIDFLTTNTSAAQLQRFQMALGNNNLYWTEPTSSIGNISFKVKDPQNQVVYEYNGPSSELEAGLLRTLNNSCGNENICESPYNLRATVDPDNNQTIVLTWDSEHDPEFGYCIYRDGFLFNMAHELRYVDENTDIGGHCYYVTALCNGGETANSNEYCATSGEGCEPPKDFYFNYNGDYVQLTWSASGNSDVSGYIAYRKNDDLPYKRVKVTSANTTTFRDQTAAPGTEYQYVVEAYYRTTDCSSAYANDLFDSEKFFINVDWSNTPKDLQAELVEEEETYRVNLRWKPAYQATAYDIMRNGEKIGEVTGIVFEDNDLELGASYCYQIVAHGDEFETSSNEACVTIPSPVLPCSAPSNLRREEPFGAAHIAWDAPEDRVPDSYTVVIINHQLNDTTNVTGLTELFYEEAIHIDITDKSYKVKAVYDECESEFALNANGEDFIRVTNLSVDECQMNLKLYPNPTSGQLSIEAVDMTLVSVYDLVGQCVMQMTADDNQTAIDLSQLQNGIYFIKVNTANGSAVQRVVKM